MAKKGKPGSARVVPQSPMTPPKPKPGGGQ